MVFPFEVLSDVQSMFTEIVDFVLVPPPGASDIDSSFIQFIRFASKNTIIQVKTVLSAEWKNLTIFMILLFSTSHHHLMNSVV